MDVEKLLAAIEETERNAEAMAHIRWFFTQARRSGQTVMAEYFTRNDPAAVLRRCAADRNTVGMCEAAMRQFERGETDASGYTLAMMVLCHLHEAYGLSVEEETTGE